ncbi:MAG: DUF362 domain-containing protein [Deltaproteobacteria bacterium]|nr:DUF362 domain-containing protein [Deltaproteobacteria bacterium]
MNPISRRRFSVLAAGGVAALAVPGESAGAVPSLGPLARSGGSLGAALAGVARGSSEERVEDAVRRAALAASDFSWLSRGDRVLIKTVCNSGGAYPFTTDPVAVRAMIGLLKQKGAGTVIVADMSGVQAVRFGKDRTSGSSRALMTQNKMAQAAEAAGAEVQAFEEAGWDGFHQERPVEGSAWPEGVMMPDIVGQVDHIVLMPRCARHVLAGSTLGLKAAVGWWRHDSRLVYHHRGASLPEKTAEANSVPSLMEKQRLVLSSATKVVSTFGPDNGYVSEPETGLIIASSSVVAHDMLSLTWLLENLRLAPDSKKSGFMDDPHLSPRVVGLMNRVVVSWLDGGFSKVISGDSPPSIRHQSIWDDRMLRRAFEIFGGVPSLEIADAIGDLPAPIMSLMQRSTQRPS